MSPLAEKASAWRGRAGKFLFLVLVLAIGYSLFAGQYGLLAIMDAKSQLTSLDEQEKTLTAKLVDLEIKIDRLNNDPLLLEKMARERYRLARPNEVIVEF